MKKKIAFLTGVNGQDGAYLSKLLIDKNYEVHGLLRRSSTYKIGRLDYLGIKNKIVYHHSELNEHKNVEFILKKIKPDVIYNLAAQSFVQYSFGNPSYTFDVNCNSVLNILELLRRDKMDTKFYQASTSEMFGNSTLDILDENSSFNPASPYAISKLAAHHLVKNYRDSYNKFICNGILFNHESFLRGIEFVTKKIVNGLVNIKYANGPLLKLGNLDTKRDWGHAEDYVKAMYLIMKYKRPDDYVVATGETYSVRDFITLVTNLIGMKLTFVGSGAKEYCVDKISNKKVVIVDKKYFRDNELYRLKGNPKKIKKILHWKPQYNFQHLVEDMVRREIDSLRLKSKFVF